MLYWMCCCKLALVEKVPCGTRKRDLTSLSGCLRPDSRIAIWLHGKGLAKVMGEKAGGHLIV